MLPNMALALIVMGATLVAAVILFRRRRQTGQGYRLLPGPVPLPIVGSFFSIDMDKPWVTYARWTARYGDIFRVRVMNQDIIVLNSKKVAKELLYRRSRIYSDRPYIATRIPFGWTFNFAFESYGNLWRLQKRIFMQAFRYEATLAFHPVQSRSARQLVLDILDTPHDWSNHIFKFSAAVLMSVVYDYEVTSENDPIVESHNRGSPLALERLTPEMASVVKAFPFLLSLPAWFPGAVIKRNAELSKYCATRVVEGTFNHAVKQEAAGSIADAMAINRLRSIKDANDPWQLQVLKDTCATAFIGGSGTIGAISHCFMLAMLEHPEVQERAWEEIDAVVGTGRLPDFDDRPNLPYIEAILLETLRMYPILPMGISRATMDDDVYEDFFIPKGSTVVANIWAMHHDKDVYPEPDIFNPERFFVDGRPCKDKSVDSLAYGFGRRLCPGRFVADSSLWVVIASILSAFKITKARDEQGNDIEFEPVFSCGVISAPLPFPCSFSPRWPEANIRAQLGEQGI